MDAVLGLDLGGTALKWAVCVGERLVAQGSVATGGDHDAIVATMCELVAHVDQDHGRMRAIGVGVPGHVDRTTGVVRFLPNVSGRWGGFPLGATLRQATGRPVTVLNDARAFCLAELALGAARGRRDALFLTLGTGVGGGVLVGGRLLAGPDDRLGEIGHLTYDRSGPRCGCGGRGCLETYASAPALVRAARELGALDRRAPERPAGEQAARGPAASALTAGEAGALDRHAPERAAGKQPAPGRAASGPTAGQQAVRGRAALTVGEQTAREAGSAQAVVAAALAGDAMTGQAVAVAGTAIGRTLASLCAVLPAEAVIVGGGVAAGLPALRPHIEAALAERADFIGTVEVLAAELGPIAGAVGAALVTREAST